MRRRRQQRGIIYVNYSPYENSGKILDFLLDNFEKVFLFSLGFHQLRSKKKYNKLIIYTHGKLRDEKSLMQIPVPQKLFFFLLPFRSLITFFQIVLYSRWINNRFGKIDVYFTVNGFTAWIGVIIKKIGFVNRTVFWVWDYYPPIHDSKVITFVRRVYWQFDKISSRSDYVSFVNQKLIDLRKDMGILSQDAQFSVIPIGTEIYSRKLEIKKNVVFGFIGVLKKSHGLDLIFDNDELIMKYFPNARLEIIGSGPDEDYFKKRAKKSPMRTKFYGYVEDENINDILKVCSIGIATYRPDKSNVSLYGDPGKVKRYISLGIPVIITNVVKFSEEIDCAKAGISVQYNSSRDLIDGIKKIMSNYTRYQKNAVALSKKYYYKDIYRPMFMHKY